jgi:small-conductance mechanosensitive channel
MEFDLNFIFVLAFILIFILVLEIFMKKLKKKMLKKAKSKKQISNIKFLSRMFNIIIICLVLFIAFFSYMQSWTSLGIFAGLITAGLGFALQKPITSIAAWIIVVLKRPFNIGDRVTIGNVKGDVYDISLFHVYLDEVGGIIDSEELSGRTIMIPNHLLFENNIINYTLINDFILGEVVTSIIYESDLDKAIKIIENCANKYVSEYHKQLNKELKIRVFMDASSMVVKARFFAPAKMMQEVVSNISKDIYTEIKKEKKCEIAYPHTEIVFKGKK